MVIASLPCLLEFIVIAVLALALVCSHIMLILAIKEIGYLRSVNKGKRKGEESALEGVLESPAKHGDGSQTKADLDSPVSDSATSRDTQSV